MILFYKSGEKRDNLDRMFKNKVFEKGASIRYWVLKIRYNAQKWAVPYNAPPL